MNHNWHDQIPEAALHQSGAGKKVAQATVIETWGASPRPVGAQLLISDQGEMVGSVSGGCVEGAVVAEAQQALRHGECKVLEFGVADETAFSVGLTCGGRIRVLVEPIGVGNGPTEEILNDLVTRRAAREPVAWVVSTNDWSRQLVSDAESELAEVFSSEQSTMVDGTFVGLHLPPLRLIVVGAVHIAQPLAQMAKLAGYDLTIIDPRDSFGSEQRFPDDRLLRDWPDTALKDLGLDRRTAVATLTHDSKLDLPAIMTALNSDVFYLGCLGSKRTHAKRVEALKLEGFDEATINRIHGPIGLDIGAKSPAEIAVSIMAELTLRLRRPESRP